MSHASKILVIVGSVRARRICPQIADWVAQIGRAVTGAQVEGVDLKEWQLPADQEPGIPAIDDYQFEATRAWAERWPKRMHSYSSRPNIIGAIRHR